MKIRITKGTNVYDLFIIPTIRINARYIDGIYITIEWLKFYIGIAIDFVEVTK